jgi:hypothetical protein
MEAKKVRMKRAAGGKGKPNKGAGSLTISRAEAAVD